MAVVSGDGTTVELTPQDLPAVLVLPQRRAGLAGFRMEPHQRPMTVLLQWIERQ